MCESPRMFGRDGPVQWLDFEGPAKDAVVAATMQHRIAVAIGRHVRTTKGLTMAGYAQAAGITRDRLGRILRGEQLMRLEDFATAQRIVTGLEVRIGTSERAARSS